MTRNARMFNRGSILPTVLEIETGLAERAREAREKADKVLSEAKRRADSIVEAAKAEVRRIDREEREKLLNAADERVEELERVENEDMIKLNALIDKNRRTARDAILKRIVPGDIGLT